MEKEQELDLKPAKVDKSIELKFIDKIGVELEGAWFERQEGLHDDRSVTGYTNKFLKLTKKVGAGMCPSFYDNYLYNCGEMVSQPMTYPQTITYLEKNWPDDTMERCGFHIHVSFKNVSLYSKLMEREFFDYFLIEIEKWGKKTNCQNQWFWDRLRGNNQFCTHNFIPEKQSKFKTKGDCNTARYSILNYCFGIHKTLECRLLPTFQDKAMAISAFNAVIEIFETYLTNNLPKEEGFQIEVQDDTENKDSEEIVTIDENPTESLDESVAKPKVKDIIKSKKAKSLGLRPYNLFVMKNKAEGYIKPEEKKKKETSCFFDIISGHKKTKENDLNQVYWTSITNTRY